MGADKNLRGETKEEARNWRESDGKPQGPRGGRQWMKRGETGLTMFSPGIR